MEHNGTKVILQDDGIEEALKKKEIPYTELPEKDLSHRVLKYVSPNGERMYVCIKGGNSFLTDEIPEDGWEELMLDVMGQVSGEDPRPVKTARVLRKISTHTPLAGRDVIATTLTPILYNFYSHAPRGT